MDIELKGLDRRSVRGTWSPQGRMEDMGDHAALRTGFAFLHNASQAVPTGCLSQQLS